MTDPEHVKAEENVGERRTGERDWGGETADRRKHKCKCKSWKLGLELNTEPSELFFFFFAAHIAFPNTLYGDLNN